MADNFMELEKGEEFFPDNARETHSPYTGHEYTCKVYDTLDQSDCTCHPITGDALARFRSFDLFAGGL